MTAFVYKHLFCHGLRQRGKVMWSKNKSECVHVCIGFSCYFFSLLVEFFLNNPWASQHISWGDTELYCCDIGILGALILLRAASSPLFMVKYMHLQMCLVWKYILNPALTTQLESLIYLFVFPLGLQKCFVKVKPHVHGGLVSAGLSSSYHKKGSINWIKLFYHLAVLERLTFLKLTQENIYVNSTKVLWSLTGSYWNYCNI